MIKPKKPRLSFFIYISGTLLALFSLKVSSDDGFISFYENEIISETLFLNIDPIHLNDIEPAFENTNYWKKL